MIITTTPSVPGLVITKILGVVSANQVLGNNLISENIAAFTDLFGGKSLQYRSKLDELVEDARNQLLTKAKAMYADAIVGFSLNTSQISSEGMSMFMITATGTAVSLETDRYSLLEKLHKLVIYHNAGVLSDDEYKYEETRIKEGMFNVVATETKDAIERKRIQEEKDAEYRRIKEETAKKYAEEQANAIKLKTEMLEFIKQEFPKHKIDVEMVDLNAVPNATYQEDLPDIQDLSHYDIMRYLVALGKTAGACKYYCDKYNLPPSDARDYLLNIYGVI